METLAVVSQSVKTETAVIALEPRPLMSKKSSRSLIKNGTIVGGGAGALGIALIGTVVARLVRGKGKGKKAKVSKSNSASPAKVPAKTESKTAAFGSPSSVSVSPIAAIKFDLDLDPKAQLRATKDQTSKPLSISLAPAIAGLESAALPPGSMSKHLAILAEAQEENKKLRRFLETHSSDSSKNQEKLSKLEQENQDLRACMQKLESQLKDIISRPTPAPAPASAPSSGEELAMLKEKLSLSSKLLNIKAAQSVCSDNDADSIGGHSMFDAAQRKKVSTLAQLLGWSNSTSSNGGGIMSLFPKSPAPSRPPSQPSTPRGTRTVEPTVPPAQVIKMLDAAFSGGPQGSRIMF